MYKGELHLEPAAVRPRRSNTVMWRARALTPFDLRELVGERVLADRGERSCTLCACPGRCLPGVMRLVSVTAAAATLIAC